ncbi:MAG: outer membrane beta-barrel protein [Chitinophagales bacterium]|jgi:opacity protein-like surface antigen|nr:PorT family protein [Bacteroidota bacterium]MBK9557575.1 PorT family protein [Bacteroidota bacterium]MBL0282314.1 PorT family protein [Bacteroidota bacterium]MBP8250363.1 PorT family protein [Chitinophagales bacterium]MBP9879395.1 PorT family protein [Chitinophagales bacterium]
MKKTLLTLSIVLFVGAAAQAQQGIHFGFHGQMNSIWILNQNNYEYSEMDYEYKFGPNGGLTLGYNWEDNFGIQVEFNYAQMGQDYSDIMKDFGPTEDTSKPDLQTKVLTYRYVDLNYLQVPILFKYMEGDTKDAIKYQLLGGLQLGYLLSAEQTYTADVMNIDPDDQKPVDIAPQSGVPDFRGNASVNGTDYFQKLDVGLLLDVGADIYVNDKLYFSPSFRGYYGFFDINAKETRNLQPAQGENIYLASHNAYIGFSLGINFMFPDAKLGGSDDE